MGTDISGWVEITDCFPELPEENDASPVFDIAFFAHRRRKIFARLFGIYPQESRLPPVAPSRGFPSDVSQKVKDAFAESASINHSPTWITLDEILSTVNKEAELELKEGETLAALIDSAREWRLLFDLLDRLAEDYPPERIRLTVWFDS